MNKFYSSGGGLSGVGAVMSAYYGDALTVHYNSATSLIFSGSGVTDNIYVEFFSTTSNRLRARCSGSLVSGSALESPTEFGNSYNTGTVSALYFVFCPSMVLACQLLTTLNSKVVIVGVQTDGTPVGLGTVTNSNSAYWTGGKVINIRSGSYLTLAQQTIPSLRSTTNKFIKLRPTFVNIVEGFGIVNNAPPYIPELYICTAPTTVDTVYNGDGIFVTTSVHYVESTGNPYTQLLYGSFCVENIET